MKKLAIFASGRGSNALSIINYFRDRDDVKVSLILSNNPGAGVLDNAGNEGDVVTVVAPPFIESSDRSGLGPLLRGVSEEEVDLLTVIPTTPGDPSPLPGVQWTRSSEGWQAQMAV